MIFTHRRLLKELRRKGGKGTGEILSLKTLGQGTGLKSLWAPDDDLSARWPDCRMRLKVTPEDQGQVPFEATVTSDRGWSGRRSLVSCCPSK